MYRQNGFAGLDFSHLSRFDVSNTSVLLQAPKNSDINAENISRNALSFNKTEHGEMRGDIESLDANFFHLLDLMWGKKVTQFRCVTLKNAYAAYSNFTYAIHAIYGPQTGTYV